MENLKKILSSEIILPSELDTESTEGAGSVKIIVKEEKIENDLDKFENVLVNEGDKENVPKVDTPSKTKRNKKKTSNSKTQTVACPKSKKNKTLKAAPTDKINKIDMKNKKEASDNSTIDLEKQNSSYVKSVKIINKTDKEHEYEIYRQDEKYKEWSVEECEKLVELNNKHPHQWSRILKKGKRVFDPSRNYRDLSAKIQRLEKRDAYNKADKRIWNVKFDTDKTTERFECKFPIEAAEQFSKKYKLSLDDEVKKVVHVRQTKGIKQLFCYFVESAKSTARGMRIKRMGVKR